MGEILEIFSVKFFPSIFSVPSLRMVRTRKGVTGEEPPAKRQEIEAIPLNEQVEQHIASFTSGGVKTLIRLFSELENEEVRKAVMPLVKFDSWIALSPSYRSALFSDQPRLESLFKKGMKTFDDSVHNLRWFQVTFLSRLVDDLLANLERQSMDSDLVSGEIELVTDLLSQLPTRRAVKPILIDRLFAERAQGFSSEFQPLIDRVVALLGFPINDFTAEPLSRAAIEEELESRRDKVRAVCWKSGLHELGLASSAQLFGSQDKCDSFLAAVEKSPEVLKTILCEIFSIENFSFPKTVLSSLFLNRLGPLEADPDSAHSVLPTELDLVPSLTGLGKLGLQYLSWRDYFLRNEEFFRIEAGHIVLSALEDAVPRLQPSFSSKINRFSFTGSARMALPVEKFEISEIKRNSITSTRVSSASCSVTIDLRKQIASVQKEWDSVRPGDVVFFVALKEGGSTFHEQLRLVRGGEIVSIADVQGNVASAFSESMVGDKRIITVQLDAAQVDSDLTAGIEYTFDVIVRMKDSHFKSVVENVVALRSGSRIPEWLSDFLLGFGDPNAVRAEQLVKDPSTSHHLTDEQAVAVASGLNENLTVISGGPGTGKSVAVASILEGLAARAGRTLVVAKSNESLNALLAKLGVAKEYVFKPFGASEDAFSKNSVINHILQLRLELLAKVKLLAVAVGTEASADDFAYSCDTARQFCVNKVQPAIRKWKSSGGVFPFTAYFQSINIVVSDEASAVASVENIFNKLEECAAFEILRTVKDRSFFLLNSQSRIVATTSAAVSIHFKALSAVKFDSLVVEDSGQMLDLETTFAIAAGGPGLERVVLVGDPMSLPPVVTMKDLAPSLSSSLFARIVRSGIQPVRLTQQLRAPSIASLWTGSSERSEAITGFTKNFQFIQVDGQETQPMLHFFQNVPEAEYIVAVYMYLRLCGWAREQITILTSYNGQRLLIEDVLKARCASNPVFGDPATVTTIDQYQSQENDVVLISLVRTETPGHNADVRRLISALSRAKAGAFVFGTATPFEACSTEVKDLVGKIVAGGTKLALQREHGQIVVNDVQHMWNILQDLMRKEIEKV